MQRDMDLVRKLLQWMESQEHGLNSNWQIEIDGYTDEQIGYHAYLMDQAGLIAAVDATCLSSQSPDFKPLRLTWAGHDFLSAAKDEKTWTKAKKTIFNTSKSFTIKVLMKWLEDQAIAALPGIG